jgi:SOS-response transcriptional repressor LexA
VAKKKLKNDRRYPNRIRELRTAAGMTLEQVAHVAGTTHQQIERLEKGIRRLTDDWMKRIAPAFRVPPQELLDNGGHPSLKIVQAPLISWVQAGRLIDPADPYEPGSGEDFIAVDYHRPTVVALRVEGSSMNRVAPSGSVVIVDYEDKRLVDRGCYIIKINGEVAFKRYRASPDRFEPDSTEPDHPTYFDLSDCEIVGRAVRVSNEL